MNFLRRALETFDDKSTGNADNIIMKGPLSDVYTQALAKVYAKNNDEDQVGDSSGFAPANDELVSNGQTLESHKEKKKKLNLKNIKKGSFHEWLGKKPGEEIIEKDIEKGLKDKDPHVRKMAQFAKNAKKWHHKKKKVAKESFNGYALESFSDALVKKYVAESQQMDSVLLDKMAEAIDGNKDASPTDNFVTIYGVSRNDVDEEDAVDVMKEINNQPEVGEFILVTDYVNGDSDDRGEKSELIGQSLECMVECYGGRVFHSFEEFLNSYK